MTRKVPCGSCTACCQGDLVLLHPEMGDRVEDYETEEVTIGGKPGHALSHKSNGHCFYLGEKGCTIHDRAPAICREFDCRDLWRRTNRAERRRWIAAGVGSKEVFDAGRERALADAEDTLRYGK